MSKRKRAGIILVLIGLALPIASLGLSSKAKDYDSVNMIYAFQHVSPPKQDIIDKLLNLEILIHGKGNLPVFAIEEDPSKIAIPYKYIFALGVIFFFVGMAFIILNNHRESIIELKKYESNSQNNSYLACNHCEYPIQPGDSICSQCGAAVNNQLS